MLIIYSLPVVDNYSPIYLVGSKIVCNIIACVVTIKDGYYEKDIE